MERKQCKADEIRNPLSEKSHRCKRCTNFEPQELRKIASVLGLPIQAGESVESICRRLFLSEPAAWRSNLDKHYASKSKPSTDFPVTSFAVPSAPTTPILTPTTRTVYVPVLKVEGNKTKASLGKHSLLSTGEGYSTLAEAIQVIRARLPGLYEALRLKEDSRRLFGVDPKTGQLIGGSTNPRDISLRALDLLVSTQPQSLGKKHANGLVGFTGPIFSQDAMTLGTLRILVETQDRLPSQQRSTATVDDDDEFLKAFSDIKLTDESSRPVKHFKVPDFSAPIKKPVTPPAVEKKPETQFFSFGQTPASEAKYGALLVINNRRGNWPPNWLQKQHKFNDQLVGSEAEAKRLLGEKLTAFLKLVTSQQGITLQSVDGKNLEPLDVALIASDLKLREPVMIRMFYQGQLMGELVIGIAQK
jgi:hypothetical protein